MGSIKISGIKDLSIRLNTLGESGKKIAAMALYKGAGACADEVKSQIMALSTDESRFLRNGDQYHVVTETLKGELASHVGIARFEHTGDGCNTVIGLKGYSSVTTKKYPNGFPLPMIARAINSGSSVRAADPFFRRAKSASRAKARKEIIKTAEDEINKIIK